MVHSKCGNGIGKRKQEEEGGAYLRGKEKDEKDKEKKREKEGEESSLRVLGFLKRKIIPLLL